MVKDLIFVDPEDETPVKRFAEILGRMFEVVEDNDKLGDVLTTFKQGRGHMAIVRGVVEFDDGRDNEYVIKGIITLEDIVEAILGDEIIDETDQFIHMESRDKVNRQEFDYGRLDLLDSKLNENNLTNDEVNAIAAHLISNNEVFKKTESGEPIDINLLKSFLRTIQAMTLFREGDGLGRYICFMFIFDYALNHTHMCIICKLLITLSKKNCFEICMHVTTYIIL